MEWIQIETNTHQDHVIKHVLGATVLGWLIAGEAAHLLLDIGFLWTIYLDAEMNTSADKTELAFDAQLLLDEGCEATGLKRFMAAPVECLIVEAEVLAADSARRILIRGEISSIEVETSSESGQVSIRAV